MDKSIQEQAQEHFSEMLYDFCYEFYEHLKGYGVLTVSELTTDILAGFKAAADNVDKVKVQELIKEASNDFEYDDPFGSR